MKTFKGTLAALLVLGIASSGILGCNTFRGAGKDIQRSGEVIEDAAEDAQSSNAQHVQDPAERLASAAYGTSPYTATQAIPYPVR